MDAQYTLSTFAPGEAEVITGLTTTMQRDWRRPDRGYLVRTDGHARFDCFDLAKMLAMKVLADRGLGPQLSKEVAEWCALGISWQALATKAAFEGDHERTFDWNPEGTRPARELKPEIYNALKKAAEDMGEAFPAPEDLDWGWSEKADWLRKQVVKLKGYPRILPQEFMIWWADGSHTFEYSVGDAFDALKDTDSRLDGPVIVLNLRALGTQLMDRAGRPLVHVEFPADPDSGEIEQPIQYGTPVPFEASE